MWDDGAAILVVILARKQVSKVCDYDTWITPDE